MPAPPELMAMRCPSKDPHPLLCSSLCSSIDRRGGKAVNPLCSQSRRPKAIRRSASGRDEQERPVQGCDAGDSEWLAHHRGPVMSMKAADNHVRTVVRTSPFLLSSQELQLIPMNLWRGLRTREGFALTIWARASPAERHPQFELPDEYPVLSSLPCAERWCQSCDASNTW